MWGKKKTQLCLAQHKRAARAVEEPAPALGAVEPPFRDRAWYGRSGPGRCRWSRKDSSRVSHQLTLQNFHRENSPGVFQVGDVNIASCVAGQANVQNPGREKTNTTRGKVSWGPGGKHDPASDLCFHSPNHSWLSGHVPNLGKGRLVGKLNHRCRKETAPTTSARHRPVCLMAKPALPFLKLH